MIRPLILALALLTAAVTSAHAEAPLRIVIFGASGEVGTLITQEALNRGHSVRAITRNPEGFETTHDNLTVMRGDLLDKASIAEAINDQEVVVISVRGVIGDPGPPQNALQFIAARNVVDVLIRDPDTAARLLHVGGSGSLEVEPGVLYAEKIPDAAISKKLETEIDGQILALEYLKRIVDVDWTYLTPPKNFTNGPRTGEYRIGGDQALEDDRGRTRLSRADFAVALIDEAERAQHPRQRISLAY